MSDRALRYYDTATDRLNDLAGLQPSLDAVVGTDPAAGAEISEVVPAGQVWELLSARFSLTTDSTATTRHVRLTLETDSAVSVYTASVHAGTQGASTSKTYQFAQGIIDREAAGNSFPAFLSLPTPTFLLPGWTVKTETVALQAGDDFDAPTLHGAPRARAH